MFWTSIAELKSRDEVKAFFKDLLSESEAIMLARRIKIAERLLQGVDYEDIQSELHVGRSTIASVHQWLTSGFRGYETAIKKFSAVSHNSSKGAKSYKKGQSSPSRHGKNKPRPFSLLNLIGGQK